MGAPDHCICLALESKLSLLVRLLGTFAVPLSNNVMCMQTHKSKRTHERWDAICRFGQVLELWWPPIPADADIAASTPEPAKIPKATTLLWEKKSSSSTSFINWITTSFRAKDTAHSSLVNLSLLCLEKIVSILYLLVNHKQTVFPPLLWRNRHHKESDERQGF